MENVKVQVAACSLCGNNIKVAATETTFERMTTREFAKLMEAGFVLKSCTLEEARTIPLYCDNYPKCQLPSSEQNPEECDARDDHQGTEAG